MRRLLPRRLAPRIALVVLAVAGLTLAILAAGVLGFGAATFERLMVEHGSDVALSRDMFEHGVTLFFVAAAGVAAVGSIVLAIALARGLSAPLGRLARAARRIADGQYETRVPRHGSEELVSLADSFNQMAESLADQERMRREFIANAAHELRTPLTNLLGYLEALRDDVVTPSAETFESLREEVDRLVRLARSLDTLADGEASGGPPAIVDLDLSAALANAVALARPSFEQRGIKIELIGASRTLRARADADHLTQVLANLLQNAARYTPQGGRVTVSAEPRASDVLVMVSNTGDGIPPDDLPRVFERFYRVEKSRDRARGGAGIGLAIVKRLVELGGGRVGAESAAGLTRFWFSLPV